jgi:hypothetical protein
MRVYECPECGKVKESDDWLWCSRGHKEVGMYEILHLGREELLAMQNKLKKQGSK